MKKMNLSGLVLLSLFFLASCNNKKEENKKPDNVPVTGTKTDTIPNPKPVTPVSYYSLPDVSPMDMCYYPVDYPKLKTSNALTTAPLARVIYSRPHLGGRKLFDGILKYGEPWRLGANEATELDLYSDALIQDKKINAGRYVLYCIPEADKWTIVINSNIDTWGLGPDPKKDIARFVITPKQMNSSIEFFTMQFEKTATGAELIMAWSDIEARLPVRFK